VMSVCTHGWGIILSLSCTGDTGAENPHRLRKYCDAVVAKNSTEVFTVRDLAVIGVLRIYKHCVKDITGSVHSLHIGITMDMVGASYISHDINQGVGEESPLTRTEMLLRHCESKHCAKSGCAASEGESRRGTTHLTQRTYKIVYPPS
jgi:hypothetical protein